MPRSDSTQARDDYSVEFYPVCRNSADGDVKERESANELKTERILNAAAAASPRGREKAAILQSVTIIPSKLEKYIEKFIEISIEIL